MVKHRSDRRARAIPMFFCVRRGRFSRDRRSSPVPLSAQNLEPSAARYTTSRLSSERRRRLALARAGAAGAALGGDLGQAHAAGSPCDKDARRWHDQYHEATWWRKTTCHIRGDLIFDRSVLLAFKGCESRQDDQAKARRLTAPVLTGSYTEIDRVSSKTCNIPAASHHPDAARH